MSRTISQALALVPFFFFCASTLALELQGFVTKSCRRYMGLTIYATEKSVEIMDLDGNFNAIEIDDIDVVYVFNIIENPFTRFKVDDRALSRLKSIYIEDSHEPRTIAFPTRYIEDLVIFYSLDGKSHVHRIADIYKLRPAPESAKKVHTPPSFKNPGFEFSDQGGSCQSPPSIPGAVKPTRVLADKISIAEFLGSFEQGYDNLESFQERTYLYAKPFLFDRNTRLGIVLQGQREEPGLNLPIYFQWSSGEAYRFQSFNVVGLKTQEFTPNADPVFAIRSDVKSHAFHALFVGNVAGLPAGNNVFLGGSDLMALNDQITVQPSFNYIALMGGDYGPYSISGGLFYPSYGIRVGDEYREVLGSKASYMFRVMYTKSRFRVRAVTALTDYSSGRATKDDVSARTKKEGSLETVDTYKFNAAFLRGGIDYDLSPQLRISVDGIYTGGSYRETRTYTTTNTTASSDIKFRRLTTQFNVRRSFGDYVSLAAYANIIENSFESNFLNQDKDREQRETNFLGTLEFIF
jgi:hypothetical protein